nr:Chain A, Antennapedia protein [synthetic construct]
RQIKIWFRKWKK